MRFVTFAIFMLTSLLPFMANAASYDLRPPESFDEIEQRDYDNPQKLREWALQAFRESSSETQPKLWLLAFLALSRTKPGLAAIPDYQKQAEKAATLAEGFGLKAESIIIRHNARHHTTDSVNIQRESLAEAIMAAEKAQLPRLRLRLISDHADLLMGDADVEMRGRLLNEVSEGLKSSSDLTKFDRLIMKNSLALYLDVQGQLTQAEAIYREIIPELRQFPLRGALSGVLYNLGRLYFDQKEIAKIRESRPYFEESYLVAKDVGDFEGMGAALMGASDVYRSLNQHVEAIAKAKEAVRALELQGDAYWLSRAHTSLARALSAAGRYGEANQAIQAAERVLPEPRTQQKWEWASLRTESFKAQEKWKEAFLSLEEASRLSADLSKEAASEKLAQQAVKLGLDVESERVKVLQKHNELQNERLQRADEIRTLLLSLLALTLVSIFILLFAMRKEREVRRQKHKTESILDSLEEGVLLIDGQGLVEPGYSRYLTQLLDLQEDPAGQRVTDCIFSKFSMTDEARSMLNSTLTAILGENLVAWEMNASVLPHMAVTIAQPQKTLDLHWQAIQYSKSSVVNRVLLGIRDVTERQQLQAMVQAERVHSQGLYEKFGVWLRSNRNLSSRLARQLADLLAQETGARAEYRRELHTLKGVSRSLGYESLSSLIHRLEDEILIDANGTLRTLASWPLLKQDAEDLLKLVQISSGPSLSSHWLSQLEASWSDIEQRLLAHGYKDATLEIKQIGSSWPEHLQSFLSSFIVHGLNNAVDHGFLRQRLAQQPGFQIMLETYPDSWEVSISDSGAGIDWVRLQEIARDRGFVPKHGRPLSDLLFQETVSTTTAVSQTSGRGLGLAALEKSCQELGGSIILLDRAEGSGACMRATIPRRIQADPSPGSSKLTSSRAS